VITARSRSARLRSDTLSDMRAPVYPAQPGRRGEWSLVARGRVAEVDALGDLHASFPWVTERPYDPAPIHPNEHHHHASSPACPHRRHVPASRTSGSPPHHLSTDRPAARIALLANAGLSVRGIARRAGCQPATVRKLIRRVAIDGRAGLRDADRPGRPRRIVAEERCSVIAAACATPEQFGLDGITEWSARLQATSLVACGQVASISARTVQRILARASLKPHRCDYWKRATDPAFEAKMRPIIDLYLRPPSPDRSGASTRRRPSRRSSVASLNSDCVGPVNSPSAKLSTSATGPVA
jgi:transposase